MRHVYRSICPNGLFRSKIDKQTLIADQLDTLATDYSSLNYKLPFEKVGVLNYFKDRM